MTARNVTLLCEGEPNGEDIRWLGLALESLGEAGRVDVVPCGSKANLRPSLEARRRWHAPSTAIVAVRDRDFLTDDLLNKDLGAGIVPVSRYCLESYMIEPSLIEEVFTITGVEALLCSMAERRFWTDVGRAVLDAYAFDVRNRRGLLSVEDESFDGRDDVVVVVREKIEAFVGSFKVPDVATMVIRHESDMRQGAIWARVDGKELLKSLQIELQRGGLLAAHEGLETRLFGWCEARGAPSALAADLRHALARLGV